MEVSQNENVNLNIDGENKISLNECNIQNENLNDRFQIVQSITKKIPKQMKSNKPSNCMF
jgi:hypothetical protein